MFCIASEFLRGRTATDAINCSQCQLPVQFEISGACKASAKRSMNSSIISVSEDPLTPEVICYVLFQ